ncbi:AMP-binding protein [Streptomyces sp. G3]|uniref:AMP-binding protein n=1 Tax=unclassified Streptomyces TaxID=2593676 RepID=UPI002030F2F2|nr:AMP-binding protein [Streptomyces sp. G3]MCM1938435.1 AMP-binding protein [Streptomyces sp. G3]
MSNIATAVVEAAEQFPTRLAVQDEERALTYAELDELSARAAGGLLAHGVGRGDRVGLRLPHAAAFAVLCFGALRAGAVVVPLFPQTRKEVTRPGGDAFGAEIVFARPDATRKQDSDADAGDDTMSVLAGPDFLEQVAFWPQRHGVADRTGHTTAVMAPGQGTTASGQEPAVLSHRSLRDSARTVRLLSGLAATHDGRVEPERASCPTSRTYGMQAVLLTGACLPACLLTGRGPGGTVSRSGSSE